ncbi:MULTISPECIES: LysR family transcriptional regulator [Acinetobacter]|uniref:LysR family transcriptional regulator n=3 Tax=Acinetobacter TaxID=469 RepID=A0A365PFX3_ACIJU|nr:MULTISPECIES: LysR family transcriptional regulator [Acinetobacter]USI86024.1 LysR family transcriptional regulator [Acinetobacter johnsonii]ENU84122.1 hypothetical protein F974_00820 [Acinetobacter sp. CIP 102159]ENX25018.1 hypothetical protein F893_00389 [Acinetobacter sp. CIP 102136]ENX64118.1 hypothetical protein F884_01793 [Acinetobacter sp. CIP 102143]EPG35721.1 hypothetical protein F907_03099 [Acinetobacter colistiniresistens]
MDIKGLKVFNAVIETGSFSGAAQKLHCVQPNITSHINKLESLLGVRLLVRSPKGICLTAEGVKLKKYSDQILDLVDAASDDLSSDNNTLQSCPLDIGILQTVNQRNLIDCIQHLNNKTKQPLSIKTMSLNHLKSELIAGNIDCGLINEELIHPCIYNIPLWKETAVLCYNNKLFPPLTQYSKEINLIAYPKGCYYRQIGEKILLNQNINFTTIDFDNIDNIYQAVLNGLGYAVLPHSYIERMNNDLITLQEIHDTDSSVQIWFSCQNRYLYNFKELYLLHDILIHNVSARC